MGVFTNIAIRYLAEQNVFVSCFLIGVFGYDNKSGLDASRAAMLRQSVCSKKMGIVFGVV